MALGSAARLIQSKTDWQVGMGSNQWWRSLDTSDPSRPESHCGWRCKGLSNRYRGWSRRCFGMVRSPKEKGQRSHASTTPCPIVQSVHPSSGTCFDQSPGGGWCWIATGEAHHLGCMMWFPRRRRGSRLRGCSWQKTASPKPRHRGCLRVDLRQGLRPNQDLSSVQYQNLRTILQMREQQNRRQNWQQHGYSRSSSSRRIHNSQNTKVFEIPRCTRLGPDWGFATQKRSISITKSGYPVRLTFEEAHRVGIPFYSRI